MKDLIFLKLGGSLITDKDHPLTALIPQIDMLARQIDNFLEQSPTSSLLLGHGSGSFGHYAASKYNTRNGVSTPDQWEGFSEVWFEARALNQVVIESLERHHLKPICFPFSALVRTDNRQIDDLPTAAIEQSLNNGLLPVIYGDVVLDRSLGGTILSTEEQFQCLATFLHPSRILLAGIEQGVWEDFPQCSRLYSTITLKDYALLKNGIGGSASTDVTGGMASKVSSMFSIIERDKQVKAQIFSGVESGSLLKALKGELVGTSLTA